MQRDFWKEAKNLLMVLKEKYFQQGSKHKKKELKH